MSGKKGRSGPPNNLNHNKHPWRAFWRRRALRASDKWILPTLESYSAGLASDKSGLTEAEARLIEISQTARGATMLILSEAARSGFIVKKDNSWDLAPGAKELAKFLAVEKGCLQVLGLGRRAKPMGRLTDLLAPAPEPTPPGDPKAKFDQV